MSEVRFLTIEAVLDLHRMQIDRFGGDVGLRDLGLVESAMAQPCQSFGGEYLHKDLPEMAAAYLYHLCCNHAFIDGNKRVATITAVTFLGSNGFRLDVDQDILLRLVRGVALGEIDKDEVIVFFRTNVKAI
jgi:death-on-curing protein